METKAYTAGQIADRLGLELRGDGGVRICGVASLGAAGPDELGFMANPRYRDQLAASRAGVVILRPEDADSHAGTVLLAPDPYVAYARAAGRGPGSGRARHPSQCRGGSIGRG